MHHLYHPQNTSQKSKKSDYQAQTPCVQSTTPNFQVIRLFSTPSDNDFQQCVSRPMASSAMLLQLSLRAHKVCQYLLIIHPSQQKIHDFDLYASRLKGTYTVSSRMLLRILHFHNMKRLMHNQCCDQSLLRFNDPLTIYNRSFEAGILVM